MGLNFANPNFPYIIIRIIFDRTGRTRQCISPTLSSAVPSSTAYLSWSSLWLISGSVHHISKTIFQVFSFELKMGSKYCLWTPSLIILYRIANSVTPKPTMSVTGSVIRSKTQERKLARRRRTNLILMMVSIVFFLAWAPIHIYLLLVDIIYPNQVRKKLT